MNENAKTIAVNYVIKPVITYAVLCAGMNVIDTVVDKRKARKLAKKADHFVK